MAKATREETDQTPEEALDSALANLQGNVIAVIDMVEGEDYEDALDEVESAEGELASVKTALQALVKRGSE